VTKIKIKLLRPEARVPKPMSKGSGGYDLYASQNSMVPASNTSADGGVDVGRALIPVGIAIEIPIETIGRIASRSGLSVHSNLEVGAGWIDSDYRGEVMVELKNFSSCDFEIKQGDRIAQLILLPIISAQIVVDEDLEGTSRGTGGLGSTGI
jgi:dUTP pyrophosphatase